MTLPISLAINIKPITQLDTFFFFYIGGGAHDTKFQTVSKNT